MSEKRSKRACLRHQRGASLPLALLLTLICAMAASVVLAASTAAVGRASNLAETDQAYYSTTSAVVLFRDNLLASNDKGHAVTVAVKADTTTASPSSYQVLVQTDGQTESGDYTLLERAAMKLLFGATYGNAVDNTSAQSVVSAYFASNNWASWPIQGNFFSGECGSFELEHNSTEISTAQRDALEINVDTALTIDGSLLFSFRKTEAGASSNDLAEFSLCCDANYEFGTAQTSESGRNYEIKYVTITWTPSAIEKGSTSS